VDSNDWAIERAAAIFARYGDFIRRVISFQASGRLDGEDLYQEFYLVLIEKPIPTDVQNIGRTSKDTCTEPSCIM
jgi:hypothetical protein